MNAVEKYEAEIRERVEKYGADLRERVRALEASLGRRSKAIQSMFNLTPPLARTLDLLLHLPSVNADMIDVVADDANLAIHCLRKALEPSGVKVRRRQAILWSGGYWINGTDKMHIRMMLRANAGEQLAA
jgi:hypothetical protein